MTDKRLRVQVTRAGRKRVLLGRPPTNGIGMAQSISIKFTPPELMRVRQAAQLDDRSVSNFIRHVINAYIVAQQDES